MHAPREAQGIEIRFPRFSNYAPCLRTRYESCARMHRFLAPILVAAALAGCAGDPIREFTVHVGWSEDVKSQYLRPSVIRVGEGDRVRFVVINDDDPQRDYNGENSGRDNFHDVALLDYDGNGDGVEEDIEHEVPAGRTTRTCLPQAGPDTKCAEGKDFFRALEKGTFRILCEVRTQPTHEELGMKGTLIVE